MLNDMKALWKSLIVNLAVISVWYVAEYKQFRELQWDRLGDNIISILYILILWYAFHTQNKILSKVENGKEDKK